MTLDDPGMGRRERIQMLERGFTRVFCFEELAPERLSREQLSLSMERAAGIVASIMEDTAISRWFFPADTATATADTTAADAAPAASNDPATGDNSAGVAIHTNEAKGTA
jgi:hypothetical protein